MINSRKKIISLMLVFVLLLTQLQFSVFASTGDATINVTVQAADGINSAAIEGITLTDSGGSEVAVTNGSTIDSGTYHIVVRANDGTNRYALAINNVSIAPGANTIDFLNSSYFKLSINYTGQETLNFNLIASVSYSPESSYEFDTLLDASNSVYLNNAVFYEGIGLDMTDLTDTYVLELNGLSGSINSDQTISVDRNFTATWNYSVTPVFQTGAEQAVNITIEDSNFNKLIEIFPNDPNANPLLNIEFSQGGTTSFTQPLNFGFEGAKVMIPAGTTAGTYDMKLTGPGFASALQAVNIETPPPMIVDLSSFTGAVTITPGNGKLTTFVDSTNVQEISAFTQISVQTNNMPYNVAQNGLPGNFHVRPYTAEGYSIAVPNGTSYVLVTLFDAMGAPLGYLETTINVIATLPPEVGNAITFIDHSGIDQFGTHFGFNTYVDRSILGDVAPSAVNFTYIRVTSSDNVFNVGTEAGQYGLFKHNEFENPEYGPFDPAQSVYNDMNGYGSGMPDNTFNNVLVILYDESFNEVGYFQTTISLNADGTGINLPANVSSALSYKLGSDGFMTSVDRADPLIPTEFAKIRIFASNSPINLQTNGLPKTYATFDYGTGITGIYTNVATQNRWFVVTVLYDANDNPIGYGEKEIFLTGVPEIDGTLVTISKEADGFNTIINRTSLPASMQGFSKISVMTFDQSYDVYMSGLPQQIQGVQPYDEINGRDTVVPGPGMYNVMVILFETDTDGFDKPVGFYQQTVTIGHQISGQVLDTAGNPLANHVVKLVVVEDLLDFVEGDQNNFVEFEFLKTDANGSFTRNIYDFNYKAYAVYSDFIYDGTGNIIGEGNLVGYIDLDITPVTSNIEIQLATNNVAGAVTMDEGAAVDDTLIFLNKKYTENEWATADKYMVAETFGRKVNIASDGSFSIYLPVNEAQTENYILLGKSYGFGALPPKTPVEFTVTYGQTTTISSAIAFPAANVAGTIVDANGNPTANAMVAIMDIANNVEPFMAMTNSAGEFAIPLSDGSYKIVAVVSGGLYMVNVPFDVVNGLVENGSLSSITLPAPNTNIAIQMGGTPVTGGADITLKAGSGFGGPYGIGIWSQTGSIDMYLVPGNYTIVSVFSQDVRLENINKVFSITTETTNANKAIIVVDAAESSNVRVRVIDDSGNPLQGVGIPIDGITYYYFDWKLTGSNGYAYFNLQPGTYVIRGYDKNGMWHELNKEFTVGTTTLDLTVTVMTPNVTGVVLDENSAAIPNGWLSIRKLGATDATDEYLGFNVDGSGAFNGYLAEGKYVIEGIGTPSNWIDLRVYFSVENADADAALEIVLPNGTVVETLTVQKQSGNLTGTLYKTYVDAANNNLYSANKIWMTIRQAGITETQFQQTPWLYESWVEVNPSTGAFSAMLEPTSYRGKQYYVKAINIDGRYIELNTTAFSVPNSSLIVSTPTGNFNGMLMGYDGNAIGSKGWMQLENKSSYQWYSVDIDSTGYFNADIPSGTYTIREVVFHTGTTNNTADWWKNETRIVFNKVVTIGAETQNMLLQPNVKGTITFEAPISSFMGAIIREDIITNEPWKYEKWAPITPVLDVNGAATNVGNFYLYLDDNNKSYKLSGISSQNGWIQLDKSFVLNGASSTGVAYDSGKYTISFAYTTNVFGEIRDASGNPVQDAWVNIEKVVMEQTNTWDPANHFGANTNSSGQFALSLEDGTYKISGYNTPGAWDNTTNRWITGEWISINYKFKVTGGVMTNMDDSSLTSIIIQPNVSGTVRNANGEALQYAWFAVKPAYLDGAEYQVDWNNWNDTIWVGSDETGSFSLMLKQGSYKVVEAGANNYWKRLNIDFQIDGSNNLVVDNKYLEGSLFVIKPDTPNVKGFAYKDNNNNVLNNGWVAFKPANSSEHDWSKVVWTETNENGYFEITLPVNTSWRISEMSNAEGWYRVATNVSIAANGTASTNNGVIDGSGNLIVAPPQPNFSGTVANNNNGTPLKAWITIKPASAGADDWTNARGVEAINGSFSMYLEPGDYKVVNVGGENGPNDYFWYESNQAFTITSGQSVTLAIAPPEPNVTGTVHSTTDTTSLLGKGWIGVSRYDADTGAQLQMNGSPIPVEDNQYLSDGINYAHARWTEIDANGSFGFVLQEGTYKIISVSGENTWYKSGQIFTVGTEPVQLTVTKPGPNVTITVSNTGFDGDNAWIEVQGTKDGMSYYVPVAFESKNGADGYVFSARLDDGSYKVTGFGAWNSTDNTNLWSPLSIDMNVSTSAALAIDFSSLVQTDRKVGGTITNIPVNEVVWIEIVQIDELNNVIADTSKWVQTDRNGNFSFMLPEGQKWRIKGITTSAGYRTLNTTVEHTVTADEVQPVWAIDYNTDLN